MVAGIGALGYFLVHAAEIIDSFTSDSNIDETWNIEVDTGAGEVKLATRSCDSSDWFCTASTTCSNLLGDGEYIIVARMDVSSSTYQWKTSRTDCDIPQCGQDGGSDGDHLVADNTVNFADYPARDACESAGGRLPTKTELGCIYTNRSTFGDNFESSYYWSATEDTTSYAYRVYFSDGSTSSYDKGNRYYVRCVRGW